MTELGTTFTRPRSVAASSSEEPGARSRLRPFLPYIVFAAVVVGLIREGGNFDWGANADELKQTRLGWLALGLAVFCGR